MRVHFICRGNAFRSRIAEAYLSSLQLPGVTVQSSGIMAARNADNNGPMPAYTRTVLQNHNLLQYAKPSWDQLSTERMAGDDVVIVMGATALHEMQQAQLAPAHLTVWDVPDTGELFEGSMTPVHTSPDVDTFAEENYQRIKELVDKLKEELI